MTQGNNNITNIIAPMEIRGRVSFLIKLRVSRVKADTFRYDFSHRMHTYNRKYIVRACTLHV